jgi:hypothetical protein
MLTQFKFNNGSNSYITKTNDELFRMLKKYYCEQISEHTFFINDSREWEQENSYQNNKMAAAAIVRDWQQDFSNMNYSIDDLRNWQEFFEEIGKKYGLLKEFRENVMI